MELHDVTAFRKQIGTKIENLFRKQYTIGALYRLAIQDILASDKTIYLDCDTLVNMDIAELWNVDTGDCYVAGVIDEAISKAGPLSFDGIRCRINGCKASSYINSGVLVMDLRKIRDHGDFFMTAVRYLKHHTHSATCPDQDIINSLFFGAIKFIDKKFNRHTGLNNGDLSGTIIHTIWQKPWKTPYNSEPDKIYWGAFLKSAWGENMTGENLSALIFRMANYEVSSSGCMKSTLRRLLLKIRIVWKVRIMWKIKILILVSQDMYYRLKYAIIKD